MANQSWDDFKLLEDYRKWVETSGNQQQFTFKVGVFSNEQFYFDQFGFFFRDFIPKAPTNKKQPPEKSILGEHTYSNIILSPEHLFEKPNYNMVRQGDIFMHNSIFPQVNSIIPSHWIIASQTCVVDHELFCNVVPAYIESILTAHLEDLGIRRPNPPDAIRANKKSRLLAFPPSNLIGEDQTLIIDLGQGYTMECSKLKTCKALTSLTFPGNAYFACRSAMYQFRDVKDWDDQRSVRK